MNNTLENFVEELKLLLDKHNLEIKIYPSYNSFNGNRESDDVILKTKNKNLIDSNSVYDNLESVIKRLL